MKQQFIKNTTDTFRTYIYENNRKIIPSSASLTVYRPGGDSRLVDEAAMSVGADGVLTRQMSASENALAGVNYKAVITYAYNLDTCFATLFYDVVNSRLSKVVTDDDVVRELPQLKDAGWKVRGTAASGSDATITDPELKRYEDGYFTGGLAYSAAKDEAREITGFTSTDGTVTTEPFSATIIIGERYILSRSFSREIQRAFEKMEERLVRLGKRPDLVLDPYDLREAHIYYSVAEVCKGLVTGNDTFWWEMWKEYEKKAENAFEGINLKYDSSADGYVSAGEEDFRLDTIRAVRK